jgi:L-amino acid N-acyltransferase YncA
MNATESKDMKPIAAPECPPTNDAPRAVEQQIIIKEKPYTLRIYDNETIQSADVSAWEEAGLVFLHDLSRESYRMRFDTTKPESDELLHDRVEYFRFSNERQHKLFLVTDNDRLVAAASLFNYKVGVFEKTDTVVELSLTVADDMHRKGVGSYLLSEAIKTASEDGKTHIYTSFSQGNEPSRKFFTEVFCRIFGIDSILDNASPLVAGATNPLDKFWRLPGVVGSEYEDLELLMKRMCGDTIDASEDEGKNSERSHVAAMIANLRLEKLF